MRSCPKCGNSYPENVQFCPTDGSALGPEQGGVSADPLVGTLIDRYRVTNKLGEGGMGAVYKAEHTMIGRPVALKVLHPDLARVPQAVDRFFREARAANEVASDHIVEVTDFGKTDDGANFLVMEFLTGVSLQERISKEMRLDPVRAARIALQITSGLGAAHQKNVVHRDLKPANVQLIDKGGSPDFVKLLDFGIAKITEGGTQLTKTGMILGSPAYMSPEQASGGKIDHRTDIYALGIILYEMLVGAPPFTGDSPTQILLAHVSRAPDPPRATHPEVPQVLEALIMECLAKDPDARPASMEVVSQRLDAWLTGAGATQHGIGAAAAGATAIPATMAPGSVPGAPTPFPGAQAAMPHAGVTPPPPGVMPPGQPTPAPHGQPAQAMTGVEATMAAPGAAALQTGPGQATPLPPAAAATGASAVDPNVAQATHAVGAPAQPGGNKTMIIIACIIGVMAMAGAATAYFLLRKSDGEPTEDKIAAKTPDAAALVAKVENPDAAAPAASGPDASPSEESAAGEEPTGEKKGETAEKPGRTKKTPRRPGRRTGDRERARAEPPVAPRTDPRPRRPDPPARPKVTIRSVPPGATIYSGSRNMGRTPRSFFTESGFKVTLKRHGYRPHPVTVPANYRGPVSAKLVRLPEYLTTNSLGRIRTLYRAGQMTRFQYKQRSKVVAHERKLSIKAVKEAYKRGAFDKNERNRRIDQIKAHYH